MYVLFCNSGILRNYFLYSYNSMQPAGVNVALLLGFYWSLNKHICCRQESDRVRTPYSCFWSVSQSPANPLSSKVPAISTIRRRYFIGNCATSNSIFQRQQYETHLDWKSVQSCSQFRGKWYAFLLNFSPTFSFQDQDSQFRILLKEQMSCTEPRKPSAYNKNIPNVCSHSAPNLSGDSPVSVQQVFACNWCSAEYRLSKVGLQHKVKQCKNNSPFWIKKL